MGLYPPLLLQKGGIVDNINTLISENDKKIFVLAKKKYLIGKLSVMQVLKIIKYIINVSGKVKEVQKQFAGNKNTNNLQDILNVLEVLNDEQIAEVESILLNENDKNFVKNNLDFEKLIELLAIVLENNDIKAILKNVKRLTTAIQKEI